VLTPENVIYFYHEDHEGLEDNSLHYLQALHGNKTSYKHCAELTYSRPARRTDRIDDFI
jgi:hypothetical protein